MNKNLAKAVKIIVEKADPEKIILFGSRARGANGKDSDYDICVIKSRIRNKRRLARKLYQDLYGVGIPIDLIVETPSGFKENGKNPFLVQSDITKDGKVLFERSI